MSSLQDAVTEIRRIRSSSLFTIDADSPGTSGSPGVAFRWKVWARIKAIVLAYLDEHPADEDAPPTSEWVAATLGQVPIVNSPYGCDTYVLVKNLLYVRCCGPYTTLDDWSRFAEIQTIRTKRRFLELARAFEIPLKTT